MSKKLPQGWKKLSIEDVLLDKISGEWGKECESEDEGVYVLRTTNFTNRGKLKLDEIVKRNIEKNKVEKKKLQYGDIILEKSGGSENQPVGRVVYFDIQSEDTYLCNNFTQILRVNPKIVNSKYLLYVLFDIHRKGITEYFQNKTTGIRNLQTKSYLEQKIKIPPLEEQERIVSILERTESAIQKRKESLTMLDELVKSRFIEMFGDPVKNPMRWEKRVLKELVTEDCTISYGIVQTGDEQKEGIPVFRPVDIVNNKKPILNELKKTTEVISNRYKKTILQGNELLITVRANIGDTCIIDEEFKGCNVGRGIVPIRLTNELNTVFAKYQLDSYGVQRELKSLAKGITLIQLNMEDLREFPLVIPPIELQNQFADFAKQVDKLKFKMEKSLEELENNFNSLMQKAFNGEL